MKKMPVRIAAIELGGEFVDWKAVVRVNPSLNAMEGYDSKKVSGIRELLEGILVVWNFPDESGNPLGLPFGVPENDADKRYKPAVSALEAKFGGGIVQLVAECLGDISGFVCPTTDHVRKISMDLLEELAEKVGDAIATPPLSTKSK